MLNVSTHARPLPVLTTETNDDDDNNDDDNDDDDNNDDDNDDDVQYSNDIDEYFDLETWSTR